MEEKKYALFNIYAPYRKCDIRGGQIRDFFLIFKENIHFLRPNFVLNPNLAFFFEKNDPLWWFRAIFQNGRQYMAKI